MYSIGSTETPINGAKTAAISNARAPLAKVCGPVKLNHQMGADVPYPSVKKAPPRINSELTFFHYIRTHTHLSYHQKNDKYKNL